MGDNMTREEKSQEKQKEIFKEQNKETIKNTIKTVIKIIIIIIIFSFLFFTYTTYISTAKIEVKEYRITNKKIPANFNGLKIIQISDLHYGSTMLLENVKTIKKMSNERKPDLVLFTGDLINKTKKLTPKEQEKLINELKDIKATLGKYAILGDEDDDNANTILNHSEFTLLKNEYDLVYKENQEPILLIGLSSAIKQEQNIENAYQYFKQPQHNANIYTITLLHEPDTVDDVLSSQSTDLFLAGHSHNGNIRIPFLNYSFIKEKKALKYDQAHYTINNSELYISSGLGTKKGIRLFCRPSINFFRLSQQ